MQRLKNISLYKILFLSILTFYINNIYIYISALILIIIFNYKSLVIYLISISILIGCNSIDKDYIKYGVVDYKVNNYYLVDKYLYKCKLYTDDDIKIGSIIKCIDFNVNDYENDLKKNIKFYGYDYQVCNTLIFKNKIYNKIQSQDNQIGDILNKVFFNITNYDDLSFNIGYGFTFLYLFKIISSKNKIFSIFLIFIYSIIFSFNNTFYILIIDIILSYLKCNKYDKFMIKIYSIVLINKYLIFNYSILISLLIDIYRVINIKCDFKLYLCFIQSILFNYIDLKSMFIFKAYKYIQIFIAISSICLLFTNKFTNIYLFILRYISYLNNINLQIRGKLSILGLIIYLFICRTININNNYFKRLILCLILLSPLNDPFMSINFIDVGQGDSILIKLPCHLGNVLIDTGSKYNYYKLNKYLYSKGIYKIDYLIITHNDEDHNGNIDNLSKDFYIKEIINEPKDIIINKIVLNNLKFNNFNNDNDNSLIYYLSVNNLNFLFTGDISSNVEKLIISEYGPLNIDILKVSHHGSATGTSKYFLANIMPRYAVISTSGLYDHPSKQVIDNLNDYLVKYFITKNDKNIEIYLLRHLNLIKTGMFKFVIIK